MKILFFKIPIYRDIFYPNNIGITVKFSDTNHPGWKKGSDPDTACIGNFSKDLPEKLTENSEYFENRLNILPQTLVLLSIFG